MKTKIRNVALHGLGLAAILAGAGALAGCGHRAAVYDGSPQNVQVVGIDSGVAVFDKGAGRAVFVSAHGDLDVTRTSIPINDNVVSVKVSQDQKTMFVLSAGDTGKKITDNQNPGLAVIGQKDGALNVARYPLSSALSQLAIDPLGRYVVVYAGDGSSFVENPNEIVVVDLQADADRAVTTRTIRSFGGRPQRLTFTQVLQLPGGARRLLVVETEQDVTILDLDHVHDDVQRPEITIPLTDATSTTVVQPGGVVVDDGLPDKNDDARIAVRLANDSNVVTLTLEAPSPDAPPTPNDFRVVPNKTDVGGVASGISFVRTDGGIRIAALVPGISSAVLVDPQTSVTTNVKLPAGYASIALITNVVGAQSLGTDVALLYGANSAGGVAFWSLGTTSATPYRSVEVVNVNGTISQVLDVAAPNQNLKVLQTSDNTGFYVLDLDGRTAQPLGTSAQATLFTSADGQRLWAFQKGADNLALVTLADLHVSPLEGLNRTIDSAWEVARDDGGRALVVVDTRGDVGLTILDAAAPDVDNSRSISGILLEGL
jgi:hypothetical protein